MQRDKEEKRQAITYLNGLLLEPISMTGRTSPSHFIPRGKRRANDYCEKMPAVVLNNPTDVSVPSFDAHDTRTHSTTPNSVDTRRKCQVTATGFLAVKLKWDHQFIKTAIIRTALHRNSFLREQIRRRIVRSELQFDEHNSSHVPRSSTYASALFQVAQALNDLVAAGNIPHEARFPTTDQR